MFEPLVYVEYSGHGSPFVRDTRGVPLTEAARLAADWIAIADTIGGAARIVSRDGEVLTPSNEVPSE